MQCCRRALTSTPPASRLQLCHSGQRHHGRSGCFQAPPGRRKGAKPPAETTDAEMQLHLLESWPTLTGVRDHQATIHWSPSIQRTLHGPQIGWLSAASNMMSRAFCTSTSSQGPTPTAHHTLRALHHCVTKNMTTPATNTNVCAWIDKAHTRRFVRATLDADHLLL